ncbi:MAG TPA: tRNA 2-thiocytidine(32) synthetase TtcA [Planctomycetota bacterium]|nr:tRNA 2-thiocytidine(32) synthetase TtcA [Planctomycetota bacterium]
MDHETEKLERKLAKAMAEAMTDFSMIEEGDRILVACSGGKDSSVLLHLLQRCRDRSPVGFEILAYHLDQGHPGFPVDVVEGFFKQRGLPYEIERQDTYSIVKEKLEPGKTTCSLCSRLRRGILYNAAPRLRCTKIALGHHREDLIETFFLNAFFAGTLATMPPKLVSDDGRNTVIRPLAYCAEEDLAEFARRMKFPVVPCTLCSEQPDLQRDAMGALIAQLEKKNPHVRQSIIRAMADVRPDHLLDRRIHDFAKAPPRGEAAPPVEKKPTSLHVIR